MRIVALLGFIGLCGGFARAAEVNFATVRDLAMRRAAEPYRAPDEQLPPRLAELSYDDARRIVFRRERALWGADRLPFQVQFYPRGGLFRTEAILHEFTRTDMRRLALDPADFRLHEITGLPALPANLGYAGFRVLHPLNRREKFDEVVSFLGASYFRALGAGHGYGLSARGLALDSGIDGRPEEFPRFAEFWLGRPETCANSVTIYALLDSPSVAGAFEFVVTPGQTTALDVKAALIFRDTGKLAGFAPLTSMFWFGENMPRPQGERRPEVHDSDGFFMHEAGAAPVWLPLQNPHTLQTTDLAVRELRRFGLAQRDREAAHYNDQEANYERRPTAWIEPRGSWGPGKVRLVELPATKEYGDNIVAYWIPEHGPARGKPLELAYRILWGTEEPHDASVARVAAAREQTRRGNRVCYAIDFADSQAPRRAGVQADVKLGNGGRLVRAEVQPARLGWQAIVEAEGGGAFELECHLRERDKSVSETWRYRFEP